MRNMRNINDCKCAGRAALLPARQVALAAIIAAMALLPLRLVAQLSTTTVQGIIYRADGSPAAGTLLVSWPAFTTPQNQAVAAGSLNTTIGADGFVSLNLTPNAGAAPAGSYYTAVYHLSDGTVNTEYWVVPAAGTAAIASIRAQLEPTTMAVQAATQAYVNSAVTALAGSALPLTGGIMTGPLTLSADPTASSQAATKHYADQTAAANLPLSGGTLSGPLAAPQLGRTVYASGYGENVGSAIAAALAAGNAVVFNDTGSFGGFTNPSNVPVDFPDLQHRHGGLTFPEIWGAKGDGTTDDAAALQACVNYSSTHYAKCELVPFAKYRFNETIVLPTHTWLEGMALENGTQLQCEVNGDCFQIAPGPVQSLTLAGFSLAVDPTLPNSVGFDATAVATLTDGVTQGGLWDSRLEFLLIYGCAQQCIKLYGGGGSGYTENAPNQFIDFDHVNVQGPAQPHPTPLIDMKGQDAQITFYGGGQVDGDSAYSTNYPQLINISNLTPGQSDAPDDIHFINFTTQNGEVGVNGAFVRSVIYDSGWIENVGTPWSFVDSNAVIVRGTHVANSGTQAGVFQATGLVNAIVDGIDVEWGSGHAPYNNLLANCSNNDNHIEFYGNSYGLVDNACTWQQIGTAPTIAPVEDFVLVNTDNCATPIGTINPLTAPGHTITLRAQGSGTFCLKSGGNINFESSISPYVISSGQKVQLLSVSGGWELLDPLYPGATLQNAGDRNAQDGIFATSAGGHNGCLGTRVWDGAGALGTPSAGYNSMAMCPNGSGTPLCYASSNTPIGSESWTQVSCGGILSATTGSIGGTALSAGACASGTANVAGATTSMAAVATPVTYPGDAFTWKAYVSSSGVVTVKVCTNLAAGGTPTASAYNVRVLP